LVYQKPLLINLLFFLILQATVLPLVIQASMEFVSYQILAEITQTQAFGIIALTFHSRIKLIP
jgi:hypothetical protein